MCPGSTRQYFISAAFVSFGASDYLSLSLRPESRMKQQRLDHTQILIPGSHQDHAGGGAKVCVFKSFKWKSASAHSNLIGRLPVEMEVSAKTKDHQSDRSSSR